MTRLIYVLASLVVLALPAQAADVGVSISVGEPGFYGHIDIGNMPPPMLIYRQPMIIEPVPAGVVIGAPIYLRVPAEQARRWRHYCGRYGACGRPVYFVQDYWYRDVYVPHYREYHGDRYHDHGKGHDKHHGDHDDHDQQ